MLENTKKKSLQDPLVTIITVVYNREDYIEETIQSVMQQSYDNIEYIVLDGDSTDSTVEVIKKYDYYISYWHSAPDKSMYDAINKGINLANGDIIGLINSDDILHRDAIKNVVDAFVKGDCDGVYGDLVKIDCNSKNLMYQSAMKVTHKELLVSEHGTFVPHPTLYLARSVFKTVGLYDLQYKYTSDFDFVLRCLKHVKLLKLNSVLVYFREHGDSITGQGKLDFERRLILKRYGLESISLFYRKVVYFKLKVQFKLLNIIKSSCKNY